MISVTSLTYDYPEIRALNNISFTLEEGSITALVGPNGAGKSTLMRCIAALDSPLSGHVMVGALNAADHPRDIHRIMGYLPDIFGMYDALTVEQTLRYFAGANGVPAPAQHAAVERVIALCDLERFRGAKAASLSRGWGQRLGIAQTIVHQPKILLLDEPASGLDPEARHSLSQLFVTLKNEGCCLLISSHILAELEDYSDRMLILRDGKLVDDSTAMETTPSLKLRITLTEDAAQYRAAVEKIGGLTITSLDKTMLHITVTDNTLDAASLLQKLVAAKLPIMAYGPEHETMQQRYLARAGAPMGNG